MGYRNVAHDCAHDWRVIGLNLSDTETQRKASTGQKAFVGGDTIEALNKIIREPPPPIATFNSRAPADLQRIVRRCLAKDPDERYQNIKDVAIELKEVRNELKDSVPAASTLSNTSANELASEEAKTLWLPDKTAARSTTTGTAGSPTSTNASSAEYIVNRLKRHKLAVALVALLVALQHSARGPISTRARPKSRLNRLP